jgi:hypothetical protein
MPGREDKVNMASNYQDQYILFLVCRVETKDLLKRKPQSSPKINDYINKSKRTKP